MNDKSAWSWCALAALVGLRAIDMLPAAQFATTFIGLATLYLVGKPVGEAAVKAADGYIARSVAKLRDTTP